MENVGIIILNYNDYMLTEKCVNNLIKLGMEYRIIIVDNASKNNSYVYLKDCFTEYENIDVIENKNNCGYAKGNNAGIKYLINNYKNIDYICIMNPDIELTYGEIIDNLIQKLKEHRDLALISANMYLSDGNKESIGNSFWSIPSKKNLLLENLYIGRKFLNNNKSEHLKINNDVCYVDVVAGCFFIIKADIFKKVEYFDERTFLYYEENILSTKLKSLGYKEGISLTDYYIHRHKNSATNKTIKEQMHAIKIENTSVRIFWDFYYKKRDLGVLLNIMQNLRYVDRFFRCVFKKLNSVVRD